MTEKIIHELQQAGSREKAAVLSRFFKTGKGEYGEGDIFIGVTVPQTRAVAKTHTDASRATIRALLQSAIHEVRLCGALIMVEQFRRAKADEAARASIVSDYLDIAPRLNNWDLVDLSAPKIIGEWLLTHPDVEMLGRLSRSACLWEQRIAIVATLTLIRGGIFGPTLELARGYLTHPHPLIHKATGWMLREVGKKDEAVLTAWLDAHAPAMPRTALRYAIERLTPDRRRLYMQCRTLR